jgi:hypothetical protein
MWHQRLGHMHSRRVSDMHKYAIGVPNLPIATEIENFLICLKGKLHKANKSTSSTRKATQSNQVFLSTLVLSCSLPKIASVSVA